MKTRADYHHYRWDTDEAMKTYRSEYPAMVWTVQPFHYDRQPQDQLVIELKYSHSNWCYLVGRI